MNSYDFKMLVVTIRGQFGRLDTNKVSVTPGSAPDSVIFRLRGRGPTRHVYLYLDGEAVVVACEDRIKRFEGPEAGAGGAAEVFMRLGVARCVRQARDDQPPEGFMRHD